MIGKGFVLMAYTICVSYSLKHWSTIKIWLLWLCFGMWIPTSVRSLGGQDIRGAAIVYRLRVTTRMSDLGKLKAPETDTILNISC